MARPKRVRQMVELICANEECGKPFQRDAVDFNYQQRFGKRNYYCSQRCSSTASGSRMKRGYQLSALEDVS